MSTEYTHAFIPTLVNGTAAFNVEHVKKFKSGAKGKSVKITCGIIEIRACLHTGTSSAYINERNKATLKAMKKAYKNDTAIELTVSTSIEQNCVNIRLP